MADQENKKTRHCSVYGCKRLNLTDGVSFHRLPNSNEPKILWTNSLGIEEWESRRNIWAVRLKLSKEALTIKKCRVCSKHFSPSDYLPGFNRIRPRLKRFAVPSLNLPESSVIQSSLKKRSYQKKRVSQDQIEDECHHENLNICCSSTSIQMDDNSKKSNQTNNLTVANNIINQLITPLISLIDTKLQTVATETVQNENQPLPCDDQNENIKKNNEEIKHKFEMIMDLHSRAHMNEVDQIYIIKQCDKLLTTLRKEIDFKKTSNLQLTKKRKIEPQARFFANEHPTLSSIEGTQIKEPFKNSTEVKSTTPMFDHSYC